MSQIQEKTEMMLDNNSGKAGTDLMDSPVEDFSCKRKIQWYPLIYLFNMIDVSLLNTFMTFEMKGCTS